MATTSPYPTAGIRVGSYSPNTFSIAYNKITIGSETFEIEQLAQLLKLLLKEHPELQI